MKRPNTLNTMEMAKKPNFIYRGFESNHIIKLLFVYKNTSIKLIFLEKMDVFFIDSVRGNFIFT